MNHDACAPEWPAMAEAFQLPCCMLTISFFRPTASAINLVEILANLVIDDPAACDIVRHAVCMHSAVHVQHAKQIYAMLLQVSATWLPAQHLTSRTEAQIYIVQVNARAQHQELRVALQRMALT